MRTKNRGNAMRILPTAINATATTSRVSSPSETEDIGSPSITSVEMQSALLQPGVKALKDMPDIDQAKVEALRNALARGEISFNPNRIASLMARYHTGR